jgi:hypothetical protein
MTAVQEAASTTMTVCVYADQVATTFWVCHQCNEYLETCVPLVGVDGFLHGECGIFLCEDCNVSGCVYYTPYQERR